MVEAYCVKCKKKGQKMEKPAINQTKRGGYMAKGKCPDCGTTMCAMMSKDNAEKAISGDAAVKFYKMAISFNPQNLKAWNGLIEAFWKGLILFLITACMY